MQLPGDDWPTLPDLSGAACRAPGVDPLWFFPGKGDTATKAKKVCAGCPVSGPCLDYALACGSLLIGTWAGTSPKDRVRLRRSILARRDDGEDTGTVEDPAGVEVVDLVPGPVPNGNGTRSRSCAECGNPLAAKQHRFCSARCQKKASYRRNRQARSEGSVRPAEATAATGGVVDLAEGLLAALGGTELVVRGGRVAVRFTPG